MEQAQRTNTRVLMMTEQEIVLGLALLVVGGVSLNNGLSRRMMKRRELDDTVGDFTKILGGGK